MELARQLGVGLDQVAVVDPSVSQPLVLTNTAQAATKAASKVSGRYLLSVFLPNAAVPLISVETVAPDRAEAGRLTDAAVAVLQSQASTDGRPFTSRVMTDAGHLRRQPIVVSQVAPLRIKLVAISSLSIKAVVAPLFVLLAWCTAVLVLPPNAFSRLYPRSRAPRATTR